jgi:anti-anti-sigma factor
VSELLSLRIEAGSAGYVVRLTGEIDLETAPALEERLAALAGDLVVDLTDVSFVDSQMLSVLIAEHKRRVAVGSHLAITGLSPMARRVFEISGVDHLLDLELGPSRSV